MSKEKDSTLTPLDLIEKLGKFDFDPCGYPGHKTAKNISCWPIDGLNIEWKGRVWLNPPYSDPKPWLEKLSEHKEGGIALVLASVETKWFQELVFNKASGILFMEGRPTFYRTDFTKVKLMRPTVLVSYDNKSCSQLYSYAYNLNVLSASNPGSFKGKMIAL